MFHQRVKSKKEGGRREIIDNQIGSFLGSMIKVLKVYLIVKCKRGSSMYEYAQSGVCQRYLLICSQSILLIGMLLVSFESLAIIKPFVPSETLCKRAAAQQIPLAHCYKRNRNFHSLILAIHGWDGDCLGTFSNESGSLYFILKDRLFYDLDCFNYDSHNVGIKDNVQVLYKRLLTLQSQGYKEIMIVTHSTGGILALQLLTDLFLDEKVHLLTQHNPERIHTQFGLKLVASHLWKVPINGMTVIMRLFSNFLNLEKESPAILPDLKPRSKYLQKLKSRLKEVCNLYKKSNASTKERMKISTYFYYGKVLDVVVAPIDPNDAVKAGWYCKPPMHLVTSMDTHSFKTGTVNAPQYPPVMIDSNALLNLSLLPRFDVVFDPNISVYHDDLMERQRKVVDAIIYVGQNQDNLSYSLINATIDYLDVMYRHEFPRSPDIDIRLLDAVLEMLIAKTEWRKNVEGMLDIVEHFQEVLDAYNIASEPSAQKQGHGSSIFEHRILAALKAIRKNITKYASVVPEDVDFEEFSSLKKRVEVTNVRITLKFLKSHYRNVQNTAISQLDKITPTLSDRSIVIAHLPEEIMRFYAQTGDTHTAETKSQLNNIVINLVQKGGNITDLIVSGLPRQTFYAGKYRPFWVGMYHDTDIERLAYMVALLSPSDVNAFKFFSQLTRYGGPQGINSDIATYGAKAAILTLQVIDQIELKRKLTQELKEAIRNSNYPSVATVANFNYLLE